MKLAEALLRRADMQKKLASLKARIAENVLESFLDFRWQCDIWSRVHCVASSRAGSSSWKHDHGDEVTGDSGRRNTELGASSWASYFATDWLNKD